VNINKAHHAYSTLKIIPVLLATAIILFFGLYNLANSPPLWWDEGWTLSVAKNWVERGHYGHLLDGQLHSAGLSASFPVVESIALFFRIFGIGVWQGRLPGVLYTFGALALLYYLAVRLFDQAVAWGALYAVLFLVPLSAVNPILNGRQVLADMPMMFFLLAGYACFLEAWRRPLLFLPLSISLWGVAIIAKAQTLPFWLVSLLIPTLLAAYQRQWRSLGFAVVGVLGSWYMSRLFLDLQGIVLRGHFIQRGPVHGHYQAIAFVPLINVRIRALIVFALAGIPTFLGLLHALRRYYRNRYELRQRDGRRVVQLALFVLATGWLGWFVLLSNGGPRYVNAPAFLGGVFVSVMLSDLTDGFDFRKTIQRAAGVLKAGRINKPGLSAILAILIAAPMAFVTVTQFYPSIFRSDNSAAEAADYLNSHAQRNALIETYDSELFMFLDRPYHYPPDQVSIDLVRRYYSEEDFDIDYDPLAADPDYLVVGPTSAAWGLYDTVLDTREFQIVYRNHSYLIYQRTR
jgi:hypothetical protein